MRVTSPHRPITIMTQATRLILSLTALIPLSLASCSDNSSDPAGLPHIDWSSSIDERTIDINDYADIEYLPLETTDESVFSYGWSFGVSDSLIVVADFMAHRFLVFDRQGRFVRSVDRFGGGPGEYSFMSNALIDIDNNEMYVTSGRKNIFTYDLDGTFKSSAVPDDKQRITTETDNYDADHFITWDSNGLRIEPLDDNDKPYRYLLINKKTGEKTTLPLAIDHPMGHTQSFPLGEKKTQAVSLGLTPIVRSRDGFIICDFASDTLYEYAGARLTPIAVFDNIDRNRTIPDRVAVKFASGRYVGLEYVRILSVTADDIVVDEKVSGDYLLDRQTGKICKYNMRYPYLNEGASDGSLTYRPTTGPANTFCYTIPAERLFDNLEQGNLRPEVESIVSQLDDEANPVLAIVRFRE